MTQTSPIRKVLSVGFEGAILAKLRQRFDICCAIAEDPTAEINWADFHDLRIEVEVPEITVELMACLEFVREHYLQFNDINSRRYYYVPGRESETYNGFMLTIYKAYEIMKQNRINLVLHANLPHEGFDFVLHQVANFLKVRSVMCYQSLIPNRFWISESIRDFGLFSKSPVLFEKESSGYELPVNWFYMNGSNRDAAYGLSSLLKESIQQPYRLVPALIRYIYARQYRSAVKKITKENKLEQKYVYFPLHLQPELTTASVGGVFADQLLAIELLSAWLPPDHLIYLKENPKQTEKQRGPLFYKRLKALKNVRLLHRNQSSIELIQKCVGVATITGTAGWEALFYGKPVIVFGSAWYREFPGVFEFTEGLKFSDFMTFNPSPHEVIVTRLEEILTRAGKGVVDEAYAQLVSEYDEDSNAVAVAESLSRFVEARAVVSCTELKNAI